MQIVAVAAAVFLAMAHLAPAVAAPTRAQKKKAAGYKKKAFKKFSEGDFGRGIYLMNKAYDARPHPGFLLNIAVAYDQWGDHCPQALDAFARFFDACNDKCKLASSGRTRFTEIAAKCPVPLEVVTSPGAANLVVDGRPKGPTPVSLELMPGAHVFNVKLEGYEPQQTTLELEHPGPGTLQLRLIPASKSLQVKAPPPPPPPDTSQTPPPQLVTPVHEGKPSLRPWAWTAAGVSAAGAIAGGVFTALTMKSLKAEEDARAVPQTIREIESHQSAAVQRAWGANVGFGVAIAGAVAATALFILEPEAEVSE